jgi:hypothetical protein
MLRAERMRVYYRVFTGATSVRHVNNGQCFDYKSITQLPLGERKTVRSS